MNKPTETEMVLALADVAGFAEACRDKSDVQMFAMLDRFYRLVGEDVSAAGGKAVKFMGDCAFVVFPSDKAKQAVRALHDLKADAENLWAAFGAECHIRVRAHIGRVAGGATSGALVYDDTNRSRTVTHTYPVSCGVVALRM